MKILFLKHTSTLNYFKEFNDEINLYGQWLTRHNIPYQFDFEEFNESLEWQQSGAHYTLSPTYIQKLGQKAWWDIGEYHIIICCYSPEKENSEGYYCTMNSFKCKGGIFVLVPLTNKMATLSTQWGWRMLVHETIHALFAILNLTYKKNILDVLDTTVNQWVSQHPAATEAEALALISGELQDLTNNVFNVHIKPHLNLILQPLPEERQASLLLQMIKILTAILAYLKGKREDLSVVDKLAGCIAKFEGFHITGSLAARNNNPGNMISSPFMEGIVNRFAYFKTAEDGWKALKYQLQLIFNGESEYYKPTDTILQFVSTWANSSPKEEIENYAKYIADEFGVGVDTKLNQLFK